MAQLRELQDRIDQMGEGKKGMGSKPSFEQVEKQAVAGLDVLQGAAQMYAHLRNKFDTFARQENATAVQEVLNEVTAHLDVLQNALYSIKTVIRSTQDVAQKAEYQRIMQEVEAGAEVSLIDLEEEAGNWLSTAQ
jgi:hypothetical protein